MQGSNEGVYNVFLTPPSKTHFFVVSKLVVFSGVFLPCLLLFIPFYSLSYYSWVWGLRLFICIFVCLFSFLNFLFYFLTSQYCIGFAIYQHESTTGIHVFPILNPPPSLYHPSGSSQCTSPKHPVSCIEPGLATRFIYDILHVSMPFSQIIPPSPSPTESKRLFYIYF